MSLVKIFPRVSGSPKQLRKSELALLTIPFDKVKPLIKLIVSEGVDLLELLSGTGIDHKDITLRDLSINGEQYFRLISNAYLLAPDPTFGLSLGEQFYMNNDGLLASRVMKSDNARQAMKLLAEYQSLLTAMFQMVFEDKGEYGIFKAQPTYDLGDNYPFFIEYTCAAVHSVGKLCIGAKKMELRYEFTYDKPASIIRYHKILGPNVNFLCKENRVFVPKEVLDMPFIFADKQAAKVNDQACQDRIGHIEQDLDIKQRVKVLIRKNNLKDVSLDKLAEQLCMSPRTLSRQLKFRRCTYKSILEDERKRSARIMIQERDISLNQLASQLGYQDTSSFSRAFKRWFGISPNQYKAER
ncbi:MAG: AraC family transcriptional regulator ligand-binding domain-containing protein [Oleispira sp.]|nr:AraC family transcriptional regulator ligand-binding domain-containing protein [Oleispira sp.]